MPKKQPTGEIKVEKGVPIPPKTGGVSKAIYPLRDLEVGDSFFVPGKKPEQLSSSITRVGQHAGRKFTARTVDGGVRVWRIA